LPVTHIEYVGENDVLSREGFIRVPSTARTIDQIGSVQHGRLNTLRSTWRSHTPTASIPCTYVFTTWMHLRFSLAIGIRATLCCSHHRIYTTDTQARRQQVERLTMHGLSLFAVHEPNNLSSELADELLACIGTADAGVLCYLCIGV